MNSSKLPKKIQDWVGQIVINESSPVKVQSSLWQNFCSAVEDGNPLYWNESEAIKYNDGLIAHPALLPSWLHDFEWHPDRERRIPMELHFKIKDATTLPLGIVTGVEIEFYEPVYDGDEISGNQKLISISELVETKLGTGRYWNIEVIYLNQKQLLVGKQKINFLGYRK